MGTGYDGGVPENGAGMVLCLEEQAGWVGVFFCKTIFSPQNMD